MYFRKILPIIRRTRPLPNSIFSIAIHTPAAIDANKGAWKLIFFHPPSRPLSPFPFSSACSRSRKRRKGLTMRQSGSRRVDRRGSRQLPPLRRKRKRRRGVEKRGKTRRETRLIRSRAMDSSDRREKKKERYCSVRYRHVDERRYLQVRLFPLWCLSGIAPWGICANVNRSKDSQYEIYRR